MLGEFHHCICTGILGITVVIFEQLNKLWDGVPNRTTQFSLRST